MTLEYVSNWSRTSKINTSHLINSFSLRIVNTTPKVALILTLQPLEYEESNP